MDNHNERKLKMKCPQCNNKMERISSSHSGIPGDVSCFIYWCKYDGVIVEICDWTEKPDKIRIPKMIVK